MSLWDIFKPKPEVPVPPKPQPYLFPLVPGFQHPTLELPNQYLNPLYYPDSRTCDAVMRIFGGVGWGHIESPDSTNPTGGVQGESTFRPYVYFAKGTMLRDGTAGTSVAAPFDFEIEAYFLAMPFEHLPEDEFPDPVFDSYARRAGWAALMNKIRSLEGNQ